MLPMFPRLRHRQVTEWNALFAGVALDLGLGVEVCWPYRPQEKAYASLHLMSRM